MKKSKYKHRTEKEKTPKKIRKVVTKKVKPRENLEIESKADHYFEAVGRRKTSVARLRFFSQGDGGILINDRPLEKYFPTQELRQIVNSPLEKMNYQDKFKILVKVRGGGIHSQAEAARHALSRALVLFNSSFKKRLKGAGFLTRDSRMRERKKFGLKRARRAPQWQKR